MRGNLRDVCNNYHRCIPNVSTGGAASLSCELPLNIMPPGEHHRCLSHDRSIKSEQVADRAGCRSLTSSSDGYRNRTAWNGVGTRQQHHGMDCFFGGAAGVAGPLL
eukprot:scaffold2581_cov84-Skeletonema_dohrnii-CCMP3373.AAC.7